MLNVAVLDDYQQVTHKYANWRELNGKINLKVFSSILNNKICPTMLPNIVLGIISKIKVKYS